MRRKDVVLINLYDHTADKNIPSEFLAADENGHPKIKQLITEAFTDLANRNIMPGQTEQYDTELDILTSDGYLKRPLSTLRISGKYRFFYTTLTIDDQRYIILLDAHWLHLQSRHKLVKSKESREIIAVKIYDAIEAKKSDAASTRARTTYQGNTYFLSRKQETIAHSAENENMLLIGSAGTGKTLIDVSITRRALSEENRVLYFTQSAELCEDVAREFTTPAGTLPDHLQIETWTGFLNYLTANAIPITRLENTRQPTDFPFFQEWKNTNKRLTFSLQETDTTGEKNAKRITVDLDKWDDRQLYAEFIDVILQPSADLTRPYLSETDYCALGQMQSRFPQEERATIYRVFERYINTVPDTHFEPPLYMHHVFSTLTHHHTLLSADRLPTRVVLDEVQQLHAWMLHCLVFLFRNATILCTGDPHQIINGRRLKVIEPIKKVFEHHQLHYTIESLEENKRNTVLNAAFANIMRRLKNTLFGSGEWDAHIALPLSLTNNSGPDPKVILYKPDHIKTAMAEVSLHPDTMMIIPENDDARILTARTFFGVSNVIPFSAAGGRQWPDIIIVLPSSLFGNLAREFRNDAIMSAVQECINTLDQKMPYSRGKGKETPSPLLSDFLDLAYTLLTRPTNSVTILTDDPTLQAFFSHTILLLREKIASLHPTAEKMSEKMRRYFPDEWVEEAKRNLRNTNPDIQKAGRAVLWSQPVWGSAERAADAHTLFKSLAHDFLNEVDFVEAFADCFTTLLEQGIDSKKTGTIYQLVCKKMSQHDFFSDCQNAGDFKHRVSSTFHTFLILADKKPTAPHHATGSNDTEKTEEEASEQKEVNPASAPAVKKTKNLPNPIQPSDSLSKIEKVAADLRSLLPRRSKRTATERLNITADLVFILQNLAVKYYKSDSISKMKEALLESDSLITFLKKHGSDHYPTLNDHLFHTKYLCRLGVYDHNFLSSSAFHCLLNQFLLFTSCKSDKMPQVINTLIQGFQTYFCTPHRTRLKQDAEIYMSLLADFLRHYKRQEHLLTHIHRKEHAKSLSDIIFAAIEIGESIDERNTSLSDISMHYSKLVFLFDVIFPKRITIFTEKGRVSSASFFIHHARYLKERNASDKQQLERTAHFHLFMEESITELPLALSPPMQKLASSALLLFMFSLLLRCFDDYNINEFNKLLWMVSICCVKICFASIGWELRSIKNKIDDGLPTERDAPDHISLGM